jgi:serine/threonine protein kinase
MEVGSFLSLAISIAIALGKLHRRGLVHKDLKPAHIVANCADGEVRLTGFHIATCLPRGAAGMGLAICRSIVDAHSGRLWADANEPRGAVFQFILPAGNEDS